MAGLLETIRRGELDGNDAVVFVHTGGSAALFAYREALTADSSAPSR